MILCGSKEATNGLIWITTGYALIFHQIYK